VPFRLRSGRRFGRFGPFGAYVFSVGMGAHVVFVGVVSV
jgi:hypothetical protein